MKPRDLRTAVVNFRKALDNKQHVEDDDIESALTIYGTDALGGAGVQLDLLRALENPAIEKKVCMLLREWVKDPPLPKLTLGQEFSGKINGLVTDLGSSTFATRKNAHKQILDMIENSDNRGSLGSSSGVLPLLLQFMLQQRRTEEDPEVKKRLDQLITTAESKYLELAGNSPLREAAFNVLGDVKNTCCRDLLIEIAEKSRHAEIRQRARDVINK